MQIDKAKSNIVVRLLVSLIGSTVNPFHGNKLVPPIVLEPKEVVRHVHYGNTGPPQPEGLYKGGEGFNPALRLGALLNSYSLMIYLQLFDANTN